ncbi:MAG TPA: phosphoenolpyruvate carboxylase [Geminicoccaceae bacterium]
MAARIKRVRGDLERRRPDPTAGDGASAADPDALIEGLAGELAGLRAASEEDPFSSPIQLLALRLRRRLDLGELTLGAVEALVQRLTVRSFVRRSERLSAWLGAVRPEANLERLRALIGQLARDPDTGQPVAFERFREVVEREHFGVVFTAHPTFSLARELQEILIGLALEPEAAGAPRAAELTARAEALEHKPDQPLDLAEEHAQSLHAIQNLLRVIRRLYGLVFDVAAELWPERWMELEPRLVTVASWVGYDLDGRSDIPWTLTFEKRLKVQVLQLRRYRQEVLRLRRSLAKDAPSADLLELLDARLALAIKQAEDEIPVFAADAGTDPKAWRRQLARAARTMHDGRASRLTSTTGLTELLERAIRLETDHAARLDLAVLRAEMATHGLGLARTHTRINARQLHNAVRKLIGMDHAPDDPSFRLSYLNAISGLIDEASAETINFGSLLAEKATARRVFMIIAQMLKYLDADQPIRFLIAECETGFTLLTALYLARLFGVEDKVEISPLFETRVGLEQGPRVIAEALRVPAFRDYVRRHGRLYVQTGYSDAGRYVGQIAAAHAIERLRRGIARELAYQDLHEIELVIFDTHGESIGRGGHPASLADRLAYLDPPATRAEFARLGIAAKQEVTFQGGDGYLLFVREESALAVLTRIMEHVLDRPDEGDDPFYREADYVQEFFAVIHRFNARIMDDPAYGALLGALGANLLERSGSRPLKRQHDSWQGQISLEHPSQLRAIPHNAILQQMGFLANTIGGLGEAVAKDPERFQRLYEESPRFRRLMTMVEHAFMYSDLVVLKAYIDLFDPGVWLTRASRRGDEPRAEELILIAGAVEKAGLHNRLARAWRILIRDYMALAAALREHRRRTRQSGAEPIAVDAEARDVMHLLHASRIALIQGLYAHAVRLPDFSPRHDLNRESLIARLLQLDVDTALMQLADIFPILEIDDEGLDFGEPATYASVENQSYALEHAQIFQPMGRLHGLIRRISGAVIHNIGALG